MKKILFRAKCIVDGKWVQGNLVIDKNDKPHIVPKDYFYEDGHHLQYYDDTDKPVFIDPATVGQYTGVNDINNVQMVEDDIVNVLIGKLSPFAEPVGFNAVVVFRDGAFGYKYYRGVVEEFIPFASCYKPNVIFTVIGNIHDNAELLGDI